MLGQILPGKMSPWQSESVQDFPRNLPLKCHQICVSNSWYIADIEFVFWVVCKVIFMSNPTFFSVVLCLCWSCVGVVTIWKQPQNFWWPQKYGEQSPENLQIFLGTMRAFQKVPTLFCDMFHTFWSFSCIIWYLFIKLMKKIN